MEVDAPLVLARWAYYGTAMILFGSSLFPLYAGLRNGDAHRVLPRAITMGLAAAALAAAVLWFFAFAAELGTPDGILDAARAILFESSFGLAWSVRLSAVALALVAALAGCPTLVVLAMLVALACEGWTGHPAASGLAGSLVHGVHVTCAAAWIGGLVPLARLVSRAARNASDRPLAEAALWRFSHFGLIFVAVIALTGAANTWHVLAGRLDLASGYNRVLLAKVALFAVMVSVASLNRYHLMARLAHSPAPPLLRALSRNIAVEQSIGMAVLLDVSALGLMNPAS